MNTINYTKVSTTSRNAGPSPTVQAYTRSLNMQFDEALARLDALPIARKAGASAVLSPERGVLDAYLYVQFPDAITEQEHADLSAALLAVLLRGF